MVCKAIMQETYVMETWSLVAKAFVLHSSSLLSANDVANYEQQFQLINEEWANNKKSDTCDIWSANQEKKTRLFMSFTNWFWSRMCKDFRSCQSSFKFPNLSSRLYHVQPEIIFFLLLSTFFFLSTKYVLSNF